MELAWVFVVDDSDTLEENWRPNVTLTVTLCCRITKLVHRTVIYRDGYLIGVEETQNCYGQLGEEDQCQAEGELE